MIGKNVKYIILLFLLLLFISSCTSTYIGRYIFWNVSSIEDYKKFPYRTVSNGAQTFLFRKDQDAENRYSSIFKMIDYTYKGQKIRADFEAFLQSTGTTAFVVIKDDTVIYEKYLNGYQRDSISRSFSVTKSITSALIGIAIDEGYIKSVHDPFTRYILELEGKGFDEITIKDLLMMTSGLKFSYGGFPWNDETILYYTPNLRKYVLGHLFKQEQPKKHFHYNNYNTVLLSIILERTTHKTLSAYLEEKIWKPLGMEYPALWSMNSEEDGLESTPSGLNARAIDFAKIGRLFLADGLWNGKRIISQKWVQDSVTPTSVENVDYYPAYVKKQNMYYKYQWWGHPISADNFNYFADGHLGQYIYVCPKKKLIIVRFGKKVGNFDHGWHELAKRLSNTIE